MSQLVDIFWAFLKPGIFGFGGGQASLPLIQEEVVVKAEWITEAQFADYIAIGNTLPGPIATKMSVIIGYDVAGVPGALVALVATVLPSTLAIILLFNVFIEYKDTAFVKGMSMAAKPVVVVLIGGVAYSMARSSVFKDLDIGSTSTFIVLGIFVVSLIIFLLGEYIPAFNVHPAIVIVVALLIGGFFIR